MGDRTEQDALRTRSLSRTAGASAASVLSSPQLLGTTVGRYQLTRVLGVGGMGIVYAGHDPVLHRTVAVKLVRVRGRGSARKYREDRLLAEARSIAALSHPNVVTVHHVGAEGGRLFLAMEYIEGLDLQRWVAQRPRGWAAILSMYLEAGRGLAAAHAHGLLHLDFKPDNVLVERAHGDTEIERPTRVVVTDFGLARWARVLGDGTDDSASEELDRAPRRLHAGTPAFMAPEQALGMDVDARADQFSFCVSLYESLFGHLPFRGKTARELFDAKLSERVEEAGTTDVPRWIQRALRRGLAADPESRYKSLRQLLDALEPSRRSRRRPMVVAGIVLGGGILAWAAAIPVEANVSRPCDEHRALAGVWDEPTRREVIDAVGRVSVPHAGDTAQRVARELDAYAQGWRTAYTRACGDSVAKVGLPSSRDATMACLHRRRAELDALVERLRIPDARVAEFAVEAARGRSDPRECSRAQHDAPVNESPLDAQLIDAEAANTVGSYEAAVEQASQIVGVAQLEARPQRLAGALLVQGRAEVALGRFTEASEHLEQAYFIALRGDRPTLAVDSAIALVAVCGRDNADFEAASQWARHAEAQLARADEPQKREAALLNNLGITHSKHGRIAESVQMFERALELRRGEDRRQPGVADYFNNLAAAQKDLGHLEDARRNFERARAVRVEVLGSRHPHVAASHNNLGTILGEAGDVEAAVAEYQAALEIWTESMGEDHHDVGLVLENLASMNQRLGRFEEARRQMERSLEIYQRVYGSVHPEVGHAARGVGMIELHAGDFARSELFARRALSIFVESYGSSHPDVARTLMDLGAVARHQGHDALAKHEFERALATWRDVGLPEHPDTARAWQGLGDIALTQERYSDAAAHYRTGLRTLERGLGPAHPDLAYPLSILAQTLYLAGDADAAAPLIDRAVAVRSGQGDHDSLLAFCHFVQAKVDWVRGIGRQDARRKVLEATVALKRIGGAGADMTVEMEQWLAEHPE